MRALSKADLIADGNGFARCRIRAQLLRSNVFLELTDPADFDQAQRELDLAELALKDSGLNAQILDLKFSKAVLFRRNDEEPKAAELFAEILQRSRQSGLPRSEFTALAGEAKKAYNDRLLKIALPLYESARAICLREGFLQDAHAMSRQIIRIFRQAGSLEESARELQKLVDDPNALTDYEKYQAWYQIAGIRAEQRRPDDFESCFRSIRSLAMKMNMGKDSTLEADMDYCIGRAAYTKLDVLLPLCRKPMVDASRSRDPLLKATVSLAELSIADAACRERNWTVADEHAAHVIAFLKKNRPEYTFRAKLIALMAKSRGERGRAKPNDLHAVAQAHDEMSDTWGAKLTDGYLSRPYLKPYWDFYKQVQQ